MLKEQAKKAVIWSALDQVAQQGLLFAVTVTMARLVSPEAYGTVALLGLFTAIASVFVDGGLTAALIQKKETSHLDESTVFWFNLGVGLLLGMALFFAAPWIASFFDKPILIIITQLYSLQFLLGACNSVQNTRFIKELDFKTPLKINTIAIVVSSAVGIFLAWKGYGIWALVSQSMVGSILRTILLWQISKWRPLFVFSYESYKNLFKFGGFLFLSGLLDTAYQRFYTVIIGKLYGVYDLGIYNRANATKQLPTSVLTGILSRVAFPIFSRANHDSAMLKRGLRLSIRGTMFINIPIMLGLGVVAAPLIITLFGDAWSKCVPLLQILALSGILWPLHVLNLSVLKAMGHSGKFFKIEIIKKVIGTILLILGSLYGMQGMAWAVVASSISSYILNAYYNGKFINYGVWQQVLDFLPALACGGVMSIAVILTSKQIEFTPPVQLITLSCVGALSYLLCCKLFKVEELNNAICIVKKNLAQRYAK
jgi:O-antigen/teichoic acid export membrane protein